MFRKWRNTSAVAAVTGVAALLAACGGSGSGSGGSKSFDIYISAQPQYLAAFAAWSKDIAAKFKAQTGASLTIETYASSADETTKIQSSVVAGSGPDLYSMGTTFTPVAYASKGFVTLSDADWQKIGGKQRYIPQTLGMSGVDPANQIGVPGSMAPFALAYNTDMFKAAGITSPPTTWDEFVTDATKLNKPSAGVYGTAIDYSDGFSPWKYIWAMSVQAGGYFVSSDLKSAGLNSPPTVAAIGHYFDLLTKDKVTAPASVGWKNADEVTAFAQQKAAMAPMVSAGAIPTLSKSPVNGHYAFAPMPTVAPGMTQRPAGAPAAASIVSGQNMAIASYSKKKDLALSFINLWTSTDEQLALYTAFGNLPTNQEAMQQLGAKNALLAPFLDIEGNSTPTSFTGAWADVQNGVTNVVVQSKASLANGNYDPAAVKSLLDKANQTAQSALDRAKK